jgi:quinohemoprotein ethanol dehydrogenase
LAAHDHPEQWLTTGGDFGKTHYSGLTTLNTQTVSRLGFAWAFDTNTNRGLEATPIVVDGVMYTSGVAGRAYALEAKTGRLIWRFEPKIDPRVYRSVCCDSVNRGVAVWRGRVYVAALDGVLYALDAATGKIVWSRDTIIDRKRGYASTGAESW